MPVLTYAWRCGTVLILLAAHGAGEPRLKYANFLGTGSQSLVGSEFGPYAYPRLAVDSVGNTYIADTTTTRLLHGGYSYAAFASKITPDGRQSVLNYLGDGVATAIVVDHNGGIYVTLGTGFWQGAVVKLAPDGSLAYKLSLTALPYAVAVDSLGAAYVTGSAAAGFQGTPGAYKTSIGSAQLCAFPTPNTPIACPEAFVAKISSDGQKLVYGSFLGGSGGDLGTAIALDQNGSAIVAGTTDSADFPTTPGAARTAYGGQGNAFAVKLDPTGGSLVFSTYLGGSGGDQAVDIALDDAQNAYLIGTTNSSDFPVTRGAYQEAYGGNGDAFFAKLDASGAIVFASYLGGPTLDFGKSIAMGPRNRFYIAIQGQSWDGRPRTPCGAPNTVVAFDQTTGQVIDHYSLRPFSGGLPAGRSIGVDGSGLVHAAGVSSPGNPGNSFAITSGGDNCATDYVCTYLARIDFSGTEDFVPYCMVNAASFANDGVSIAPGEIVSIFGIGLGPTEGVTAQPDQNGVYPRRLGNTSVRIGSVDLPLLYASDTQVNAVVPYDFGIGVPYPGGLTIANGPFHATYPLWGQNYCMAGFFRRDGFDSSQGAILNQDGSPNSSDNRAVAGSVITFFLTGLGALNGTLASDAATPLVPPWPGLLVPFQMSIAASSSSVASGMDVLYAGPAPGMPPGVYQINARVPEDARSGNVPVTVSFTPHYSAVNEFLLYRGSQTLVWIQ